MSCRSPVGARFALLTTLLLGGCSLLFSASSPEGTPVDAAPLDATTPDAAPLEIGDFYISPEGDDENTGDSPESPYRSWSKALSQLTIGKTLVVMPGFYSDGSNDGLPTGLPDIDCGSSEGGSCLSVGDCENGTPEKPIRVIAQSPRTAFLRPSNTWQLEALKIKDCVYWSVEGLVVEGPRTVPPESEQRVIRVSDSHNITLRGLLVHRDSDTTEGILLSVGSSSDLLVEDSGFYDFRNKAIVLYESYGARLRRLHVSGKGSVASPDDTCPGRGDIAIQVSGSSDAKFDNVVIEGACKGVQIEPSSEQPAHDVGIYGSLITADDEGIECDTECEPCTDQACCDEIRSCRGFRLENSVIQSADTGLQMKAPSAIVDRVTLSNNSDVGIELKVERDDNNATVAYSPANQSALISQSLIMASDVGVDASDLDAIGLEGTKIDSSSIVANFDQQQYIPDSLMVGTIVNQEPMNAGCLAYPSQSWVDANPLVDGSVVGANIRMRSTAGVESSTPLWTSEGFPCGVLVPGVNDGDVFGCNTLHERFGIGGAACPLP